MKRLSLAAFGLAIALSVGAQTAPDEKQEPAQQQGKTTTEQKAKPNQGRAVKQGVQPQERERAQTNEQGRVRSSEREGPQVQEPGKMRPSESEGAQIQEQGKMRSSEREGARVQEQGGNVSRSTTVFRNGRETSEQLNLRRSFRDRTDVHFGIGTHSWDWWLSSYSIVVMVGCHYYLADNVCWYRAYGFDPSCDYPEGVVYCE